MKKYLVVAALLFATPALAQTPPPPAIVGQVQQVINQLQAGLNSLINYAGQFIGSDLTVAIADATANNDAASAACWKLLQTLVVVQVPQGAGLAYFKQRYMDLAAQYVAVNQNCVKAAPAFVRLYDQFIMQAQALNL